MFLVSHLCLTLCDPLDCSPPGSSGHGIFQARILEWVAISSWMGSSQPSDKPTSPVSSALQVVLYLLSHQGSMQVINNTNMLLLYIHTIYILILIMIIFRNYVYDTNKNISWGLRWCLENTHIYQIHKYMHNSCIDRCPTCYWRSVEK